MKFEYDEITYRESMMETLYIFGGRQFYSLMGLLEEIGEERWELVGQVDGKIIVKRSYQ